MNALNHAPSRPARFDASSQHRRSMIAKIQIAKKQLGMIEDDYRQALLDRTGHNSLTQCSDAQLARMVDYMKSKGFSSSPANKAASHPMARKARALWISLYQLGVVHNGSEQALEAFAKRQLQCERMRWANQRDAYKLIEALKAMADRAGWRQHNIVTQKHLTPIQLQVSLCEQILVRLKKAGVVPEDWTIHIAQVRLCGIENNERWTSEDYARLAAELGERLRRHGQTLGGGAQIAHFDQGGVRG